MLQPLGVSRIHPLSMCHENHVRRPFGWPRSILHQPVERARRHRHVVVGRVMAKLVQISIRFVGNPFTISINVNARKGRRLEAVFAQIPDPVERLIGALE